MTQAQHVVAPLTARQRDVLRVIIAFREATGEAPSVRYIARRLSLHHSVVEEHLRGAFLRGWLLSPTPSGLRCLHLP